MGKKRETIRRDDSTGVTASRRKEMAIGTRVAVRTNVHKILVPVDFSERSLEALDFAVSLALPLGATILLLHVLSPLHAPGRIPDPRLRPFLREEAQTARNELSGLAKQRVKPHVAVVHRVLSGVPHSVIVEFATKAKADMIVMASSGRSGMIRFLIGSVAEKVVRHAACSVLVVREIQK